MRHTQSVTGTNQTITTNLLPNQNQLSFYPAQWASLLRKCAGGQENFKLVSASVPLIWANNIKCGGQKNWMEDGNSKVTYWGSNFEQEHCSSYTVSSFPFISNPYRKHYCYTPRHENTSVSRRLLAILRVQPCRHFFVSFSTVSIKATGLDQLPGSITVSSNFEGNFMQIS